MGIELAPIPVVGKALGAGGIGKLLGLTPSKIACSCFAVSVRFTPLEGIGCGLLEGVEVVGNMPFLWSKDQTWQIIAGTLDAVVVLVPFSVSINSVNSRLVVVAVPGTNRNELSWGNHWSVSWILVLLVAGL